MTFSGVRRVWSQMNSICSARSRDSWREAILLLFRPELLHQVGHLDGGQGRFESLVPAFRPGPINRLLEGVAGEYSENGRDAAFHPGLRDAFGCFLRDIVIMRCLAADHGSQADHGVIAAAAAEFARDHRDLAGTRHAHHFYTLRRAAGALETVDGAGQQALGDEAVEPADDDGEFQAGGDQVAFHNSNLVIHKLPATPWPGPD